MKLHLILLGAMTTCATAQTTMNPDESFAWSANCGWLNFRAERPAPGDGVRVTDTHLGGFAWSPNTGWINFGNNVPTNGVRYANANGLDFGVNHDGAGNLGGLAWSANLGWINFGWATVSDTNRPRFNISSGEFAGLAWGANVGWINLSTGLLRTDSMTITDSDGDGISDAWELEHADNLTTLTANGDADGDGRSDRDEYVADTNPLASDDGLRIVSIARTPASPTAAVTWTSQSTRVYALHQCENITINQWTNLGTLAGAAGGLTTASVVNTNALGFYRVEARLPLAP